MDGDKTALTQLYSACKGLWRKVPSMTTGLMQYEDWQSEAAIAFLHCWDKWKFDQTNASFSTFVYQSIQNHWVSLCRKEIRRQLFHAGGEDLYEHILLYWPAPVEVGYPDCLSGLQKYCLKHCNPNVVKILDLLVTDRGAGTTITTLADPLGISPSEVCRLRVQLRHAVKNYSADVYQ